MYGHSDHIQQWEDYIGGPPEDECPICELEELLACRDGNIAQLEQTIHDLESELQQYREAALQGRKTIFP